MAVLIRPRRWGGAKPSPGSVIDLGHPLAQDLAAAVLFTEAGGYGRDGVSGRSWTTGGNNPTWVQGGVQFAGVSGDHIEASFGDGAAINSPYRFTIDGVIRIFSSNSPGAYVRFGGTASGDRGVCIGVGASDFDNPGNNLLGLTDAVAWLTSSATVPTGQWAHIALTWDNGAWVLYLEGRAVASGSSSIAAAPLRVLTVGADNAAGWRVPNGGQVATARAWTRPLVSAEIQALAIEPYAFVTPPSPRLAMFATDFPAVQDITAAATLPALTASATLSESIPVTGVATLPALTAAATLAESIPVTGAATLPALTAAGTLAVSIPITAAATLPALTAAATVGTFTAPRGTVTLTATGRGPITIASTAGRGPITAEV